MRPPLYIGLPQGDNILKVLRLGGRARVSSCGGWEFWHGKHNALMLHMGNKTIDSTQYRVLSVTITKGKPKYIYRRLLENIHGILGPFTRHDAPEKIKDLLRDMSAIRDIEGNIITPGTDTTYPLLAGESSALVDSVQYIRGATEEDDVILAGESSALVDSVQYIRGATEEDDVILNV